MVKVNYFLFLPIFHLPFSFNTISFYLGWYLSAYQGLKWHLPRYPWTYWQQRSVSLKLQHNGKLCKFERFVQGQYTLAEKCFSRNVMYILLMSDSSLWMLSTALDFVEIIILKSSPTLHLIWYAIFENLFFIRFCSFSMFYRMILH